MPKPSPLTHLKHAARQQLQARRSSRQPAAPPATRLCRAIFAAAALIAVAAWLIINPASYEPSTPSPQSAPNSATQTPDAQPDSDSAQPPAPLGATQSTAPLASTLLAELPIKGRAPKTGYSREQFYSGWPDIEGCSLRQRIIKRELGSTAQLDGCNVIAGSFTEPYTGQHLTFISKQQLSKSIQIDHIVALSDAWQKGAQQLTPDARYQIATDPLNLIAADASANMTKSDGDAATWLPSNKSFRCEYVARQVSVKYKYHLWVTQAEHDAIAGLLATCPDQPAVGVVP